MFKFWCIATKQYFAGIKGTYLWNFHKNSEIPGSIPLWSYGESTRAYKMESIRPERMTGKMKLRQIFPVELHHRLNKVILLFLWVLGTTLRLLLIQLLPLIYYVPTVVKNSMGKIKFQLDAIKEDRDRNSNSNKSWQEMQSFFKWPPCSPGQ